MDSAGNAYVTGATTGNFPTESPLQGASGGADDAFVFKLNASGSALVYSTYLGGSNHEFGWGIAVDSAGNAYVTGSTASLDFPTANPLQGVSGGANDAFVSKLNSAGSALVYSTYLGGSNFEYSSGIAVDSAGSAYVTGITLSTDFPRMNPFQGAFGGGYDAFFAKISDTIQPPPIAVPVVLVHGILGDPNSFFEMPILLKHDAGLLVAEPFDYSSFTQGSSDVPIESLAGLFSAHVKKVLDEHPEAAQVDVVAHSMGGLIARAWMSGMTAPEFCPTCVQIPYEGQIRKLILIGTPNYGAELASLDSACQLALLSIRCSKTQGDQLRFGSKFIWTLHDQWKRRQPISPENILFIAGTQDDQHQPPIRQFECDDLQGCDDGVVDISSAVLPDTDATRIRYVPYRHADIDIGIGRLAFIQPLGGPTLVGITDNQHATYRLAKKFLSSGEVLDQCCGPDTVDYNPPHLRGVQQKQEGLLLVQLRDSRTHEPFIIPQESGPPRLSLLPLLPINIFRQQFNFEGGAITAWGIRAPEMYSATVRYNHSHGTLNNLLIDVARPTVPEPLELAP